MRHVVVVHRGPPAKHEMLGEEAGEHRDEHVKAGDLAEGGEQQEIFGERDRARFAQRLLHRVVEAAEPFVDLNVQLHLVPGGEQDQNAAADRPGPPLLVQEEGSKHARTPLCELRLQQPDGAQRSRQFSVGSILVWCRPSRCDSVVETPFEANPAGGILAGVGLQGNVGQDFDFDTGSAAIPCGPLFDLEIDIIA